MPGAAVRVGARLVQGKAVIKLHPGMGDKLPPLLHRRVKRQNGIFEIIINLRADVIDIPAGTAPRNDIRAHFQVVLDVSLRRNPEHHLRLCLFDLLVGQRNKGVDIGLAPFGQAERRAAFVRLAQVRPIGAGIENAAFRGIEIIVELNPVHVVFFHDLLHPVGDQLPHLGIGGIIVDAAVELNRPALDALFLPAAVRVALGEDRRRAARLDPQRVDPRVDFQPGCVRGLHHVFQRVVPGVDPLRAREDVRPREILRRVKRVAERPHMDDQGVQAFLLRAGDNRVEFFVERRLALIFFPVHGKAHIGDPDGAHLVPGRGGGGRILPEDPGGCRGPGFRLQGSRLSFRFHRKEHRARQKNDGGQHRPVSFHQTAHFRNPFSFYSNSTDDREPGSVPPDVRFFSIIYSARRSRKRPVPAVNLL